MKVRDRELKRLIEVSDKDCLKRKCYWPRLDPGSFVQGRGYRGGGKEWLCGTRHAFGCPPEVWRKPPNASAPAEAPVLAVTPSPEMDSNGPLSVLAGPAPAPNPAL